MVLVVSLTLLFLFGVLLIKGISTEFSFLETIGFAFPAGLGCVTLLMLLYDWVGIPLSRDVMLATTIVMVAGMALAVWGRRKEVVRSLKPKVEIKAVNVVWIVLLTVVAYMEYANFTKTMYFPTYDRDSMAGFDTLGYVCAQEHTYKGMSLFDESYMPKLHQAGSYITYMPMVQLAYAYVYLMGAGMSKAIPAFVFLSFIIGFYGLLRRKVSATGAMVGTLGMVATPEMLSFSSLSNTNVMHACMASAGLIYICLWFSLGAKRDIVIGSLLLGINCWIRMEGVIFVGVALILVAWRVMQSKQWKVLLPPVLSLLPLLLFSLYSWTGGLTAPSVVTPYLFWEPDKLYDIVNGTAFLLGCGYYGWTFPLVVVALIANGKAMWKTKDNLHVFIGLLLSFLFYFILLYQIDYVWDTLDNVINYSAKRFYFCQVPLAWFFIVTCHTIQVFFGKVEERLKIWE